MNKIQKYIIAIAVMVIAIMVITHDPLEEYTKVTVKYNDNLVTTSVKKEEWKNIKLKSDNDCLYFDGEYFFDEPPFNKSCKVKILDYEEVNKNSKEDHIFSIIAVIMCSLVCMLFADPKTMADDDYY